MSEKGKGIRDFPVNRTNPFKEGKFFNENKSLTLDIAAGGKSQVQQTVTHHQKISSEDALDMFGETLKSKLGVTRGGVTLFKFLYQQVQAGKIINDDGYQIDVDFKNCMIECGYQSTQSVFNGLAELLDLDIIARSGNTGMYFLNTNFFIPANSLIITEYLKIED